MKLTAAESAWVKILGTLTFVIAAFFVVQPILPASRQKEEPLADPVILQKLLAGETLLAPPEIPHG